MNIPRKKIKEIISLYNVEGELNDVFVEGHSDYIFYSWFCEACNLKIPSIYKIETIEIDISHLESSSLANNNRDRLIYLSRQFEQANLKSVQKPLCIVDRDFDLDLVDNDYLSITDYHSHEVYAFTKKTFLNFFRLSLNNVNVEIDNVYSGFSIILKSLYSIRKTNLNLKWNMQWQPIENYVKILDGKIVFEKDKFVDAYLKVNKKKDLITNFKAELLSIEDKLEKDHIHYIRGHDFLELMLVFIKKFPIKIETYLRNDAFLKKTILQAIPQDELGNYNQLNRLKDKYKKN